MALSNKTNNDITFTVVYDSGERERLQLESEVWHFDEASSVTVSNASFGKVSFSNYVTVEAESAELKRMSEYYENKRFLRHQAQGFEQFVFLKSFAAEENLFLNTVKVVPRWDVSADANVNNRHPLDMVKVKGNKSFQPNSQTLPHVIEDSMKEVLSSNCTTCSPEVLKIVAFLSTGQTSRKVYVKPPKKSSTNSISL